MTSQHPAGHAQQSPAPIAPVPPTTPRAGLALLVVATAQLMLVLDDTIANIALPSIQRDLGVATTMLPWIVSAYVLAFGALLLFGGRLGDLYGRRRVLRAGLGVFIVASLVGGLAPTGELLVGAGDSKASAQPSSRPTSWRSSPPTSPRARHATTHWGCTQPCQQSA